MTARHVLIILLVCVMLAFAVCMPIMLIARARRRKRGDAAGRPPRKEIPTAELPGLAAGVCVLFFGFAQAYLAPESWFGEQMATFGGLLVFTVGILLLHAVVTLLLNRLTSGRPRKPDDTNPRP